MKFWTYQRREIVENTLKKGLPLIPNFKNCNKINGCSKEAYNYLLEHFNNYIRPNEKGYGLIFGYSYGYTSIDDVIKSWEHCGEPSGALFNKDNYILVELDIPDDKQLLVVDFYRFTDLMFGFEQDPDFLQYAKRDLLKTNTNDDTYEFPISHISQINPKSVVKYIEDNKYYRYNKYENN